MARVLILEMNELTPRLVHQFIAEGCLPNFEKLFEQSHIFETNAGETGLNLNPWVQWYTIHSGVPFAEHKVYLLGEGHTCKVPTLADIVSDAGSSVAMFGSMNVGFNKPLNGVAMPDAWADGISAHPDSLEPFRKFVQSQVQEHTNPEFRPTLKDYASFGGFMVRHGLSLNTILKTIAQLVNERFTGATWKRPFILDNLQWDTFAHQYKKHKPDFATFFTNSVAHTQHTHWREFEPETFSVAPSKKDQQKFGNAIRDAYIANDEIIGRALDLCDKDTSIMFCTALSQRPALEWESEGGKMFYRPYDLEQFCRLLGIECEIECRAVMAEEFWIQFGSEEDLQRGIEILSGAMLGEERLMKIYPREGGIYSGCRLHQPTSDDAHIVTHDGRSVPMKEHLYESRDVKSGAHDPTGMLWVALPNRQHRELDKKPVPLEAIAPTVLTMLGISLPAGMQAAPVHELLQ